MQKKMNKIGNLCFWIALVIESVIVMIDKSAYTNPWEGILFRLTFILFCIKVITTGYSRKEWIFIAILGAIASVSYLVNDKDEVVRAAVFMISCKNVDLKKILKVVLGIALAGSVLLFALAASGIFGSMTMTANFGRGSYPGIVETRYCFGMGHPNAFHCMLLMMIILTIYIYNNKMQWYMYLILEAVNVLAFYFTDSNTGFLTATAVILGCMLMKYCRFLQNSKWIYSFFTLIILGCLILSMYGAAVGNKYGYEHTFINRLDALLNGRFQYSYSYEAARLMNWKLFASPENMEYFDQAYIRLFYWYGIIPGICYIVMNLYLVYEGYKQKDYILPVMVVGLAVYGLMEAHVISYYILRNYLFIWMGYYWSIPLKGKTAVGEKE